MYFLIFRNTYLQIYPKSLYKKLTFRCDNWKHREAKIKSD